MLARLAPCCLLGLLLVPFAGISHAESVPPNIVLFMADDMGMGDTSAYMDVTGNATEIQLKTPSMEKLARMGVRFTDAHTPSTRCTTTRYGLMTGRYCWRSRMKYWVLFGAQGDPLIESDRPTLATLLGKAGYRTAMVGKWHLGLRYRRSDGTPAAGWDDADLTNPVFDGPLEHGFDACWFTSRSHGTSGPGGKRRNGPEQSVGPGHIHGRTIIGATDNGKQLVSDGPNAYVLNELGGRHSDQAIEFLSGHVQSKQTSQQPFFLYYPANSNHTPHTPSDKVGDAAVAGAGRTVSGDAVSKRGDYIFENDVALGRLITWLENNDDPRRPGHRLIENTVVIFTSDNGAERDTRAATGPFRSNKGSCYEGGHRVPFLVAWPAGNVGDGDPESPGRDSEQPLLLTDMFATFAEILDTPLPRVELGEKGGEDSFSMLSAWRGGATVTRPFFSNDHKQAKADPAVLALRLDNPTIEGELAAGKWKAFFSAKLTRFGEADPFELYDLSVDPEESNNLIDKQKYKPLLDHMKRIAGKHRNSGGHRLAKLAGQATVVLDCRPTSNEEAPPLTTRLSAPRFAADAALGRIEIETAGVEVVVRSEPSRPFHFNGRGAGVSGGRFGQVEPGEAIVIRFSEDVLVEFVGLVAGNGSCGGTYQIGDNSPLPIYCVDADNDAKEQHGRISDLGVVRAGQSLRFAASPQFASEPAGAWRLATLQFRPLAAK